MVSYVSGVDLELKREQRQARRRPVREEGEDGASLASQNGGRVSELYTDDEFGELQGEIREDSEDADFLQELKQVEDKRSTQKNERRDAKPGTGS